MAKHVLLHFTEEEASAFDELRDAVLERAGERPSLSALVRALVFDGLRERTRKNPPRASRRARS